jgi:delta14-sterol reductase
MYALGFWMFRGANGQKHRFKLDPGARIWGAPARTIDGRLLVSGFWGLARKPNYLGEILVYWAWSLPCGFASIVPYLPALWLTCFLPHRAHRDDQRCREKYGALWTRYCAEVPYRMIPFIF